MSGNPGRYMSIENGPIAERRPRMGINEVFDCLIMTYGIRFFKRN
jgi:hypothetical protein